ncbi:MAG: biotin--[acetyl-CoA-carboxylase] ligase [Prolixibacteraceae bacterium]|nr:biotin--[acetyl-CoA-carboxylase] ligase [Prolixibacteraceae bacterium]
MKLKKIINLSAVESTNNYARGLIMNKAAEEGTVVLAHHQTYGRGMGENRWESEKGKNLTFSILLSPVFLNPAGQFYLSMVISLAVIDFISSEADSAKIKWPNDIYIGNKKVGGILIENTILGDKIIETIAGVGLNINQDVFFSDAPNPVSLKNITGKDYNIELVLEDVWNNIMERYINLKAERGKILSEEYISNMYRLNEWADFKQGSEIFSGRIIGIDQIGCLKVEKKNGTILHFQFKEIEYII